MLVGVRKDSQTYVRMKQKACAGCGMASFLEKYEDVDAVTEEALLAKIGEWNADPRVFNSRYATDGIGADGKTTTASARG